MKKFSLVTAGAVLSVLTSASTIPAANAVILTGNISGNVKGTVSTLVPSTINFLAQTGQGGQEGNSGQSGGSGGAGGSGGSGGSEEDRGESGGAFPVRNPGQSQNVPEPSSEFGTLTLFILLGTGWLLRCKQKKHE